MSMSNHSLLLKRVFLIVSGFMVSMLSGVLAAQDHPGDTREQPTDALVARDGTGDVADLLTRGTYLARMGDCEACHTAPGGKRFAGGVPFKTPVGVIYSTNITPEPVSGIGRYTFEQFDRAMRQGVAADGHPLYPAMPFPSFAKVSAEDMRALYTYLMKAVEPVRQTNRESDIPWPFSMRWPLSLWKLFFLDDTPFTPDTTHDASWNRGAYIVQGLGHCGSCHTPRGIGFQEKAMDQHGVRGVDFLAGSTVEGWHAKNIRGIATAAELVQLLKTGRNAHTSVYGTMTEVVHFSTQYLSTADLDAVGQYLESLPPVQRQTAVRKTPVASKPDALFTTAGGLGYVQFCASCHRLDGRGVAPLFPPLAGNSAILSEDPTSLIHILLEGGQTAQTQATPRSFAMPEYGGLSDAELAQILSFIRSQWGNDAGAISARNVANVRQEVLTRAPVPPAFNPPRLATILQQANAQEVIRGVQLILDTKRMLPQQVGAQMNCTSCHLQIGTMAKASPYVGLAGIFPAYSPRAGRVIDLQERINGCMKRSMNGKPLARDSQEMREMVAYFEWLRQFATAQDKTPGRGIGHIPSTLVPDPVHGAKVYQDACAVCHGKDGEGTREADGALQFPPLWGPDSFNLGAGIARTFKAAAFVKSNMPIAHGPGFPLGQGGLTDQDAVDVAQYFTHQPRPDFAAKPHDWPRDPKPADARY